MQKISTANPQKSNDKSAVANLQDDLGAELQMQFFPKKFGGKFSKKNKKICWVSAESCTVDSILSLSATCSTLHYIFLMGYIVFSK